MAIRIFVNLIYINTVGYIIGCLLLSIRNFVSMVNIMEIILTVIPFSASCVNIFFYIRNIMSGISAFQLL